MAIRHAIRIGEMSLMLREYAVNMLIAGCETADEIQKIYYGADVPEQYQSDVLKAYIASMKEGVSDVDESQATE